MGKRRRSYRWFVEPFGAQANIDIARLVGISDGDEIRIDSDNAEDEKDHFVYECSYGQLRTIKNSLVGLDIQVNFWVQEGGGKLRRWMPEKIRDASRRNRAQKRAEAKGLLLPFAEASR